MALQTLARRLPVLVTALSLLSLAACAPQGEELDVGGSAVVANRPTWSREADLDRRFGSEILPYFDQHAERGSFLGVGAKPVAYARLLVPKKAEKAALVLFVGRAESYVKYAEVAFDLHRAGYSLYILDHRGQGFSERLLSDADDHDKGYVDEFKNYVTDAETFVDTIVKPRGHARLFALGHSMGGAILSQYVMDRPEDFRAVVVGSPMFEIKLPTYIPGEGTAKVIARLGADESYAIGQDDYTPNSENIFSSSDIRYKDITEAMFAKFPESQVGGPTNRWIGEAINAGQALRENASRIVTPTLLLEGRGDQLVETRALVDVCSRAASCLLRAYDGGHELLMERDDVRSQVLDDIVEFIDSHP